MDLKIKIIKMEKIANKKRIRKIDPHDSFQRST